jgi:hypothetical protein
MIAKLRNYIPIVLLLFIAGGFFASKTCLAASAEVDITSDATEVTVGDDIAVYITIDSDTEFGNFEVNLVYDEYILEYTGGASVITGGNGFLKISDMGVSEASKSRKYALKFKALQVGSSQLSFDNRAMVYDYDTENEMSVSSNVLNIKVKAAETASTNAKLKSLVTSPAGLEPEFNTNTFEYNIKVGADTKNLIITALPEDEKSKVSISGNDSLEEGENKVIVTVLAESGDVIEYTINVDREKTSDDTSDGEDTDITDGMNNSFEIMQNNGENYAVFSGIYKLVEPGSEVMIPAGYIKTQLIISDISITAYSPENNLSSNFLLIYAMNEAGEAGFYQYDKTEKTLQRFIPENSSVNNNSDQNNTDDKNLKQYRSNLNKAGIVIALLSVVSVFLLFVIIRLFMKLKGYKEDELE